MTNNEEVLRKLIQTIQELDNVGTDLNKVKDELRKKELDLKTLKLNLEFDPEFTEGLKVKEIPHKVHNETLTKQKYICDLKERRDDLELEYQTLKYQIWYLKEVIEDSKTQ